MSNLLAGAAMLADSAGEHVIGVPHVEDAAVLGACFVDTEDAAPQAERSVRSIWILVAMLVVCGAGFAAARVFPRETGAGLRLAVAGFWDGRSAAREWLGLERAPHEEPVTVAAIPGPAPTSALRPTPAVASVAPSAPATAASAPEAAPLARDTVALLLRRGHEMMDLGDVSAARLLYARAAEAGSGEAMLAMARSFDPAYADPKLALPADASRAARWYRRAAKTGNAEAMAATRRFREPD